MSRSSRTLLWIAAGLTIAYSLGIAFNASPWLRGPEEWRWPYVTPDSIGRAWPAAVLLVAYLALVAFLARSPSSSSRTAAALLAAGLMTPLLQIGLLYLDHPDFGVGQLFNRTVSELSGGFYNVGAPVTDNREFLAHFVERMPSYPVHPQRHPPGLPLLFAWTRQALDQMPSVSATMSRALRPYQCHNLALMNQTDSAVAAAVIQMLVPVWLGLLVIPLYLFGRDLYGERPARYAVLLWPLLPSVALWATRWNQLYALFTLLAFLSLAWGLKRHRLWPVALSGGIVALATFFSLGNLVIAGFLGLFALVWVWDQAARPSPGWLVAAGSMFAAGILFFWGFLRLAYGLNPVAMWNTAMSTHLGLGRNYLTWLFYHLYDFLVFFGIPLVVFWAARLVRAGARWRIRPRDVLVLSFGLGLVLLDISGTSQGEVARVWAFLLPLALLAAVPTLGEERKVLFGIAVLLAFQVFVSNLFLQPVSTGLSDPPRPPQMALVAGPPEATWSNGIGLLSAEFPAAVEAGSMADVRLVWSATEAVNRPYTIFIHLLDGDGRLVAQADGMPLAGEWPTTCWMPGQAFEDSHSITLDSGLPPGSYPVRVGLYWLATGERLPLSGGGDSVDVGIIRIE